MLDRATLVETLKKEADSSTSAKAIFLVWAMRQRARRDVTVSALEQRMIAEKFEFTKDECAAFLKKLADMGLGKLETDAKGRIKALKEIKLTLQSIGRAACGEPAAPQLLKSRNRFSKLAAAAKTQQSPAIAEKKPITHVVSTDPIKLVFTINNKPIDLSLPTGLTTAELSAIVEGFRKAQQEAVKA